MEKTRPKRPRYRHKENAAREFRLMNVELTQIVQLPGGKVDIIGKTRGTTVFESAPKLEGKASVTARHSRT